MSETRQRDVVFAVFAGVVLLAFPARAQAPAGPQPCTDDAMIVFDASKSMAAAAGDNAGLRRIDAVRTAISSILPRVAPKRRIGLITYGPGSRAACNNISLELRPAIDAAPQIVARLDALKPDGRTPLAGAVRRAAEVLDFRKRPVTIVLLTDGEETCGGNACAVAADLKRDGARTIVHVISYQIASAVGTEGVFVSRCLADETGGTYADTTTVDEVAAALETALACPMVSELRLPR
ncbi:MAG: VWA domain-containing protein [Hyphomicrobium sp.]|jgi:Ca-activated chloride channel family protein